MNTHQRRISGFALPAVIVISALIMTVTAMVLSFVTMDSRVYGDYHRDKQRIMDLESALTIYRFDSEIFHETDSVIMDAHSGYADAKVSLVRRDWGLYECVAASDGFGHSIVRLYGRVAESQEKAAFWLCDRNRALTLDAGAQIEGTAYLPPNGVNYSGTEKDMHIIPYGKMRISSHELPDIDSAGIRRIHNVFSRCGRPSPNLHDDNLKRSFMLSPVIMSVSPEDSVLMSDGMVMLHGDEICISGNSIIHDAIICARKVTVRSGFRGCVQIFCTDSVCLESGSRLEWPSGICVASESGFPHVEVGQGGRIDGYVVVTGAKPDHDLKYPGYVQRHGAILNGLLYADCSCEIEGEINGAAYVRDWFHVENGIKYPGTISSAIIVRDERLAFPIFMQGDYVRKAIKTLK